MASKQTDDFNESVKRAKAIADKLKRPSTSGSSPPPAKRPCSDMTTVNVPRQSLGRIIGKQGNNLKKIHQYAGCQVTILPDDGKEERVLSLRGEATQVQIARDMIQQTVKDQLHGADPAIHADLVTIDIPRHLAELVLKDGTARWEARCQAKIKRMPLDPNDETAPQTLAISGHPGAVKHARFLIQRAVHLHKETKSNTSASSTNAH
ncbi:hypothetical protein DM01DRAFT_1335887, partial [Hesseltinella vesiculosa]